MNFSASLEINTNTSAKAAFLGDPNFPESGLEYYRDGRQVLIQDLYERYSGLAFTVPSDRCVAILGIQRRLARAFQTQAAYGLFAAYLARGLLWKRGTAKPMKPIIWRGYRRVPSWSWLSKEGPIKYMDLEFEKIDWATREFKSPFTRRASDNEEAVMLNGELWVLQGSARKFKNTRVDLLVHMFFDNEDDYDLDNLRCIVIGRDKSEHGVDDPKQHVLIIHPFNALEEEVYARVGVASLSLDQISEVQSLVTIC
jgi:hypothetical protein